MEIGVERLAILEWLLSFLSFFVRHMFFFSPLPLCTYFSISFKIGLK